MSTSPTAEIATAQVGDITEEQAVDILRAADPNSRFAVSIAVRKYRYRLSDEPALEWSVIASSHGEPKEQYAEHMKPTLAAAVEGVASKMSEPATAKALKLRAQAADILARAEQLESQPE